MRPRFFWLTASFLWLCVTGFAQNISYRFATQAEAQMLITDIDPFTNGWNRFDIDARLQKKGGKKSELLRWSINQTLTWDSHEKETVTQIMAQLQAQIKRLGSTLTFPQEIIFVKTTMAEEGNTPAYSRENWIALGEKTLNLEKTLKHFIAHELFHILTRNDKAFKRAMYQVIGFSILDNEIRFPLDFIEKRISFPDVSHYDSYGTFTINGTEQKCALIAYTDRAYESGLLSEYIQNGLIPLNEQNIPMQENGKTIIYPITKASDFYEKVGQNTDNISSPEEILAENFAYILMGKNDFPTPSIPEKMRNVLKK